MLGFTLKADKKIKSSMPALPNTISCCDYNLSIAIEKTT